MINPRDYWPTDDWKIAAPEAMGVNVKLLAEAEKVARIRFRGVNAFLIVKNGYLVFEKYYNGFEAQDGHLVMSVTKSITSALVGLAIDKGYLAGVEQKVLDFFPEFTAGERDDLKKELTLKHLLTMTPGFQWHGGGRRHEPMLGRLWRSKNWVEFILNLPVKASGLGKFQYNSAASHLLSVILTRATQRCAQEFANEHLFEPIGASRIPTAPLNDDSHNDSLEPHQVQWFKDPQGNNTGGWGLVLKPRDMARFGYLYLNEGRWDQQQVISKQWIIDSVQAHTPEYGYQWWLRHVKDIFVYTAIGRGGHHIFCVPEKDMVVVIASQQAGRWNDRWPLLTDLILPAVEG